MGRTGDLLAAAGMVLTYRAVVYRRLPQVFLLVAWLLATGIHVDLLQVIAWGGMFADNARILPVGAAVRQTFDPVDLCGLCLIVREVKQKNGGDSAAPEVGVAKAPLVFLAINPAVVPAPTWSHAVWRESPASEPWMVAPPVPPPRALRG